MKRGKILCSLLSITLLITSTSSAFAAGKIENNMGLSNAEHTDQTVYTVPDVDEKRSEYSTTVEDVKIVIPKKANEEVSMISEKLNENISMMLPKEIQNTNGDLTKDGSVVYNGNKKVDISIQPLEGVEGGISLVGNKTLIDLKNSTASQKYSFVYDLPDGYRMIKSEDYYYEEKERLERSDIDYSEELTMEKGWIYILNSDDEITVVIEPAVAIDADGNNVPTNYDLSGTTLTQVIEFGENSVFPIMASTMSTKPTNHKISDEIATCTINSNEIGDYCWAADGAGFALTAAGKKELTKKIVAKLGSKFVPILNIVSWTVTGYTIITGKLGYSYTKITIGYEVWAFYKHQGGRWVEGRQFKNVKASVKLVK